MGPIWETSPAEFLIVTVVLGGAGAYITGRAIASGWQHWILAVLWVLPLAAAVRFIHFALFQASLSSFWFFIIDLAVLTTFALVGYRRTRAVRMCAGYPWIYRFSGPLGWKRRLQNRN